MPDLVKISCKEKNNIINRLKITAFAFLAIFSGIFLFISTALYVTDTALLSSSRHLELAARYNIYSKVTEVIDKTVSNFTDDLYKSADSTDNAENTKSSPSAISVQSKVLSAGSKEGRNLIQLNVDNIINGMLLYFKGNSSFLPDIYLHPPGSNEETSRAKTSDTLTVATLAEAGIDRINLSAVLMYTNRYDISDTLKFIRLLHNSAASLPSILVAAAIACFFASILFIRTRKGATFFITIAMGTAGVSGIGFACILYYLLNTILPAAANNPIMSYTLSNGIITGYVTDLIKPVITTSIIAGFLFPISFLLPIILKALNGLPIIITANTRLQSIACVNKCRQPIVALLAVAFFAVFVLKSTALLGNLNDSGFTGIYGRVAGINPQIEVIPAMNETVYSLEVKLLDRKSGTPISGALVDLSSRTPEEGNTVSINKLTDNEGRTRFNVHEGYFQVTFPVEMFPAGYKLPTPITVDIKAAGTTMVTIELEEEIKIIESYLKESEALSEILLATPSEAPSEAPSATPSEAPSEAIAKTPSEVKLSD